MLGLIRDLKYSKYKIRNISKLRSYHSRSKAYISWTEGMAAAGRLVMILMVVMMLVLLKVIGQETVEIRGNDEGVA